MFSQSFQWAKRGGGIDQLSNDWITPQESVYSIVTDSNKNIYVLSSVSQTDLNVDGHPKTNFGDNITKIDYMVASFACDGSYRWSKVFGGGGSETIQNLQIDAQNNLYVAGQFGTCADITENNPPRIDNDVVYSQTPADCSITFLSKFNSNGVMQWFKRPEPAGTSSDVGFSQTNSCGLSVDAAGNSALLVQIPPGTYANGAFVNTLAGTNLYIFNYNSAGTFLNATLVDMQLGGTFTFNLKMYRNPNNGYYYFTSTGGYSGDSAVMGGQTVTHSLFMACFNAQGQFLWKKENTATNNNSDQIYNLTFDTNNNIYIGGELIGLNFDTFLGLSVSTFFSPGFVAKLDPTADTVLWSSQHNKGTGSNGAIALNGNELGFTSYSFGVDLTWGSQSLYMCAPNEASEVLFARFNKDTGACLSLTKIPGDVGYDDGGTALAVDASGDYILGGGFGHQLMVNNSTTLLNNGPQSDFFVAKYATEVCSLGVASHEKSAVAIYPNPTSGIVHLSLNEDMSYTLYTITGTIVNKGNVSAQNNTIDVSSLPSGVYLLQLQDGDGVFSLVKVLRE